MWRDWNLGDKQTVALIDMKTLEAWQIVRCHINVWVSLVESIFSKLTAVLIYWLMWCLLSFIVS